MKKAFKLLLGLLPLLTFCYEVNGQSTQFGIGAPGHSPGPGGVPVRYLGWDASAASNTIPLSVEHRGTNRINFLTGGTQRMTILGSTYTVPAVPTPLAAAGFVGINTTTPLQRLHVVGDINLQTNVFNRNEINDGYRINNRTVLAVKNSDNLFVGFGAGASWTNALAGVSENTFVGNNSGFSNNGGFHNAFFGFDSGRNSVTGNNNTFLGFVAGFNNTSSDNTFVGAASGATNTTGQFNTFIGTLSGGSNTSGRFNTYLGCYTVEAGSPSIADHNTHIGFEAGQFTTSGDRNVLTGSLAGWSLTIGAQNVISGMQAGFGTKDGSNNVFIGWESALQNTTGDRNVFMGSRTGRNQLGDSCTFIGYEAGYDNTTNTYTLNNAAGIGSGAIPTANHKMILGSNNVWVGIGLSNDLTAGLGPQNSLEINARALGTGAVIADASGLRFRQLTSTSPTIANPGIGILALSLTGDVIYVPTPAGGIGTVTGAHNGTSISTITPNFVAFGQNVGGGSVGQLLNDREIPMNNFNIRFTDSGVTPGGGLISVGPFITPSAKFTVSNHAEEKGIYINNNILANTAMDHFGLYVASKGATGVGRDIGIITVVGQGSTTANGFGIDAAAYGASPGVNYGARFTAANGGTNYALYSSAIPSATDWAGWFEGNVNVNGSLTVFGAPVLTSDQMFKTNIDSLTNAINLIKQFQPKTFNFDTANVYGINFPSEKQYGLIAQDVEAVLPELVINSNKPAVLDSLGNIVIPAVAYKSLNYNAFIAILIQGMKEQTKTIDSLSQKLSDVITTVNSCCNSNHSMQQNNNSNNSITSQDVTLKDEQNVVLETNVPNPFAEQTTINYFLPDNVLKAQMLFYNAQGKLIQSIELTEKGKGSLNVYAQDLSNGIYTYTLVVDGKVFETKKMIKQK